MDISRDFTRIFFDLSRKKLNLIMEKDDLSKKSNLNHENSENPSGKTKTTHVA